MPTTWNPYDKGAGITFANNNLTALMPAGSVTVRATTSKTAGKWYFEALNLWFGGSRLVGIALSTATLNNYVGSDANGYGFFYNGGWKTANSGGFSAGTGIVNGNYVGVCVDLDNNFIYFTNNGINIIGDPTALTGGTAIFAGAWYAATGGSNQSMTVNFGANGFAFGPPSGFIAWDTTPFLGNSFGVSDTSISVTTQTVGV